MIKYAIEINVNEIKQNQNITEESDIFWITAAKN